jgi:hypothetical protein
MIFNPEELYLKAQSDIDIIAKRTGMSTADAAKKMLELRILPSVSELIGGDINGES